MIPLFVSYQIIPQIKGRLTRYVWKTMLVRGLFRLLLLKVTLYATQGGLRTLAGELCAAADEKRTAELIFPNLLMSFIPAETLEEARSLCKAALALEIVSSDEGEKNA